MGRAIFVLISAGNRRHGAWSGGCPAPLNFTQEKRHDNGGGGNHEKNDGASEIEWASLTSAVSPAQCWKLTLSLFFMRINPNHQTSWAEPGICQSPAQADAPYSPCLKNGKQKLLLLGSKKTERGTKMTLGFSAISVMFLPRGDPLLLRRTPMGAASCGVSWAHVEEEKIPFPLSSWCLRS